MLEITVVRDDDNEDYVIQFITSEGYSFKANFGGIVEKQHWVKLLDSIKNNIRDYIIFESCNGSAEITTDCGSCIFSVSRYGGDGYGDISVTVPSKLCIDAFEKLVSQNT